MTDGAGSYLEEIYLDSKLKFFLLGAWENVFLPLHVGSRVPNLFWNKGLEADWLFSLARGRRGKAYFLVIEMNWKWVTNVRGRIYFISFKSQAVDAKKELRPVHQSLKRRTF